MNPYATPLLSPAAHYRREEIFTATPLELVRRVLGAAIVSLGAAARAVESGDVSTAQRKSAKARSLVAELRGALDRERGGEIANRLDALYGFVLARLLAPAPRPDPAHLGNAAELLGRVKAGFDAIEDPGHGER